MDWDKIANKITMYHDKEWTDEFTKFICELEDEVEKQLLKQGFHYYNSKKCNYHPYKCNGRHILQIKEKFGQVRAYTEVDNEGVQAYLTAFENVVEKYPKSEPYLCPDFTPEDLEVK